MLHEKVNAITDSTNPNVLLTRKTQLWYLTYTDFAVSNKTTSFTAKFLPSENYSLYGMLYFN